MDGRGAWRDNIFVERLWRSVINTKKSICTPYESVSAARRGLDRYSSFITVADRMRALEDRHRIRSILTTHCLSRQLNSTWSDPLSDDHSAVQKTGATSICKLINQWFFFLFSNGPPISMYSATSFFKLNNEFLMFAKNRAHLSCNSWRCMS